ncbi:MAG: ParA family partition ATPase [Prochloraceae cyanobacterium]|nr:ParA family partition ATPase [Prochloraceae cyanobacterium]
MIISVQNRLGGVGKTTIAVHIAYCLASSGDRVLLLDSDPQGSSLDWAAAREQQPPFSVLGLDRPTIHRDIEPSAENYDYVIIDGAPRTSELVRSGIIAADLVVIPVQPSPYDVWASEETVNLIREASVFKEKLKAVFVINRKVVNTASGRDVVEALSCYKIPVLKAQRKSKGSFCRKCSNRKDGDGS